MTLRPTRRHGSVSGAVRALFIALHGIMAFKTAGSLFSLLHLKESGSLWPAVLGVTESCSLLFQLYTTWGIATQRFSSQRFSDVNMAMAAIEVPLFNLVASQAFPMFTERRDLSLFGVFVMALAPFGTSPAQSLFIWGAMTPPFM